MKIPYISNNETESLIIVTAKNGLVFTSNLAESTVESLLNRGCKGQHHIRCSREGLHPLLQIRAALNSKWGMGKKWRTATLNAS